MGSIVLKADRKYPSRPTITNDPASHTSALQAMAEAIDTHERRTKDVESSFVRVRDLVDLGFCTLSSGLLVPVEFTAGGGSGPLALDDLTDVDAASPTLNDTLQWDGAKWVNAVATSGEANTASNIGSGEHIFKTKFGVDLQFRTLVEGANIALSTGADEIEISSTTPLTTKGDLLTRSATVEVRKPVGSNGSMLIADSTQTDGLKWDTRPVILSQLPRYVRGGTWVGSGGAAIVAGSVNDFNIYCPTSCRILQAVVLTAGGTGSCQVDVWKKTVSSYPPTDPNSITASDPIAITSGVTLVKTSFTGWTLDVTAGDVLTFHLDSSSTFTSIEVLLVLGDNSITYTRGATWISNVSLVAGALNDVMLYFPYKCRVTSWTITADDAAGDCVIDLRKDILANYPPTSVDSICAGSKPSISGARSATSSVLTGWSTTIEAGSVLAAHVDSTNTFKQISLTLGIEPIGDA